MKLSVSKVAVNWSDRLFTEYSFFVFISLLVITVRYIVKGVVMVTTGTNTWLHALSLTKGTYIDSDYYFMILTLLMLIKVK